MYAFGAAFAELRFGEFAQRLVGLSRNQRWTGWADSGPVEWRQRIVKVHCIWTLLSATIMASAQTPTISFDVASIKTSTPFIQAVQDGSLIGMKVSRGRVSIGHMDIGKLILTAYNIRKYQLVGPDWLVAQPDIRNAKLFDIEASIPDGVHVDQVPVMLQRLLAERFKLTIHRGSRDSETYALVVGKGGPRFQQKEPVSDAESRSASESAVVTATEGKSGQGSVGFGATKMAILPSSVMRFETSTIGGLVDYLSSRLPFPIVDKTGLKGSFDIKMEIPPVAISRLLESAQGGAPDPSALTQLATESLFAAVERLGLKLESQRNPVETIFVDHVERAPTEN